MVISVGFYGFSSDGGEEFFVSPLHSANLLNKHFENEREWNRREREKGDLLYDC